MDDDYGILEETALEEMSAAYDEDIEYDEDDWLAFESDRRLGIDDDFPDWNEN